MKPGFINKKSAYKFSLAACLLLLIPFAVLAKRINSLTTTAKGHGELTVSKTEKRQISEVSVILKEGGEAQITIFADLQLFALGHWTEGVDSTKGIDLRITGGIVDGNAIGTGKLLLRDDGKSIARIEINAQSVTGGKVKVKFVADHKNPPDTHTSVWIPIAIL